MIAGLSITSIMKDMTQFGCTYVVTGETSIALRDAGSTWGYPVSFDYSGPVLFKTHSAYVSHREVEVVDLSETIVINGITCTNQLRTIRDMILGDGNVEFICQDIFDFVYKNSLDELYIYANLWNFKEMLDYYINDLTALEIYGD